MQMPIMMQAEVVKISSKYRQNFVKISFVFRQTQFVIASVSLSLFSKKRAKMPVWSKICRHLSCKRTCFLRETKTCIDVIFLSNESKMRRLNQHGKTSPFDSMSYRNKIPQLQIGHPKSSELIVNGTKT